jgi:aldose 1-epimerase
MSQAAATPGEKCANPTVSRQPFGSAVDTYVNASVPVDRYTLTNCQGMEVNILTYGGIVQSINTPDRSGKKADVVLGFKTLDEYVAKASPPVTANGGPYFGETIGRYGNRIANGTFTLNGVTYHLPLNNNGNSLHGGLVGFGNHVWAAKPVTGGKAAGVQLTLVSPNGDQGYPGTLTVVVTYTLDNNGALKITYRATTDAPTVFNPTNHSYFNLAGESSGPAYDQKVQINASAYTPVNSALIPTGAIDPVKGTPFDFTKATTIGARISDDNEQLHFAQGYDHNWVLDRQGYAADQLSVAARAWDPASGRTLTVLTTEPGVQFYSGNFLNGTLVGISGHTYRQTAGYTFETQHYPDSPNEPTFPSTVLNPGQVFNSATVYQFSVS